MRNSIITAVLLASLGASATSYALTAKQSVETETVIRLADGSETTERAPAQKVLPGQRIVYTLNFTNDEVKPATDLVLTMPVPTEIKYLEGSASETGLPPVYSTDGGKSFAARNALEVRGTDGAVRQAKASDITNIRWIVPGPISSGASGSLSFKGIVE